jgi:hypothetical protein
MRRTGRNGLALMSGLGAALAAAAVPGCGMDGADDGQGAAAESTGAILDGTVVPNSKYPGVGEVRSTVSSTSYASGTGSLIGAKYVLTAAHVVENNLTDVTKLSFVLFPGGKATSYAVKSLHVHPSYLWHYTDDAWRTMWGYVGSSAGKAPGIYDVAILELATAPPATALVPLSTSTPAAGDAVTLVGYGLAATGGGVPSNPPQGQLSEGTAALTSVDLTYEWLTYVSGKSAVYSGDSGGPLLKAGAIIGTTRTASGYSYGSRDSFTRTSTIRPWIDSILAAKGDLAPDAFEAEDAKAPAAGRKTGRTPVTLTATAGHYMEVRSFHTTTDVDNLAFTLTANQHVLISTSRIPPAQPQLPPKLPGFSLYKGLATISGLTVRGLGIGSVEYTIEGDLTAGTYDLLVKNDGSTTTTHYLVGVSIDTWIPAADPIEPDGVYQGGTHYVDFGPLDTVINRSITNGDQDWFAFNVDYDGTNAQVSTNPLHDDYVNNAWAGDTVVDLYKYVNGSFVWVAGNDDASPSTYYSWIETVLDKGQYFVKVTGYQSNYVPFYGMKIGLE